MRHIRLPVLREEVASLSCWLEVALSGIVVVGRDAAFRWIAQQNSRLDFVNLNCVFYGSGIFVPKQSTPGNGVDYEVHAFGPTTSVRSEPFMPRVIQNQGVLLILGKGGLGPESFKALRHVSGAYVSLLGGGAQFLAQFVKRVVKVHGFESFGPTEALWEVEVENLPGIVTFCSNGENLHDKVWNDSLQALEKVLT